LHELGFKYAKINGNKTALVCLDGIWVDTHHTASYQWTPPNPSDARKIPLNKGQRFIVLHAGCKTGFLPGCELVFKT
jgi:hypothetical protein